jgi:hypothetical protein
MWKELFKPTLGKIIMCVILFTFFPWPMSNYVGHHRFVTSYLLTGPVLLAELVNIPLQWGHHYGSTGVMIRSVIGGLFSDQARSVERVRSGLSGSRR